MPIARELGEIYPENDTSPLIQSTSCGNPGKPLNPGARIDFERFFVGYCGSCGNKLIATEHQFKAAVHEIYCQHEDKKPLLVRILKFILSKRIIEQM